VKIFVNAPIFENDLGKASLVLSILNKCHWMGSFNNIFFWIATFLEFKPLQNKK